MPDDADETSALLDFEEDAVARLAEIMQRSSAGVAARLQTALEAGDFAALKVELLALEGELDGLEPSEEELVFWENLLASSYVNGLGEAEAVANSGNSEGAEKGWQTRRRNGWEPKKAKAALKDFFEATFLGEERKVMEYAQVTAAQAQTILAKTGIDVSGYKHAIDQSALRHLIATHGNPETEGKQKQVAITQADIESLAESVMTFDHVEQSHDTKQGLQALRYYKDRPDGTTVVVEAVRSPKYPRLVPQTLFKKKQKGWRRK